VGAQRTGGVERRCGDQVWYGLPQALELLVARQVLYENVAVHIMLGSDQERDDASQPAQHFIV
jgi:hypothetical protein